VERTDFEQWKAREVARLLALVETERRYYQEMVATLPVALVVLAADRSVLSANRAFRHMFGLRTEDLSRKTIDHVLPSEQLVEKIRNAHVQGPQSDLFLELGNRSLRIAVVPVRNWNDETELETLLMVEDLTAIAAMRAATPAEVVTETPAAAVPAEPVAAIPVAAPESIITPSPLDIPAVMWEADAAELKFKSVRGAVEQLLGYPATHWLETPQFFSERIHPEDRAAVLAFYGAAIARGGDASAEYRALAASGADVWCRECIRVTETEPRIITGVITDIGRRKQLEEQLLTAERTSALHGLASRLAHDLNNPLMIVTGYGEEMLNALPPTHAMRADVEQILSATERISGLTGQLLGFTQRQAKPAEPVDLTATIAGLEEKIAHAVGELVAVEIATAGEAVWAFADPEQLEQVILTLVSPVREDAHWRSRVVIGCEVDTIAEHLTPSTLKPGVYARMLIHDNGRGLDAEKRVTVFEGIVTGKAAEQNAGPALARAYAIVREWGGDIAFFSEPSRGSTFAVYLPYFQPEPPVVEVPAPVEEVAPAPAVPEPVVVPEPAPPVEETLETILVVEDEAGIRALVRKILRRERYNVLEAGTAEEALTVASAHPGTIHLLLTDVVLPGMGGRELAEQMRAAHPNLDVLYVSGYTDDEAVRTGAFPPGSKFLQKPFTLGALVGKVREALDAGLGDR
jgi:PAS domain S-box-containing protein